MVLKSEIVQYESNHIPPNEFEIIQISDLYHQHKKVLVSAHRIHFYLILWVQKGSPTHVVDFKPITIHPDSILFIPKNCVNIFDTADYDGTLIMFTDNFFCKNKTDTQFLQSTILFSELYETTQLLLNKTAGDLSSVLLAMKKEFSYPKDNVHHDILRNYLRNFLLISEREKRRQGFSEIKASADLNYLLYYKDLLENNFKTHKSVGNYASQLSISEKRLYRITTAILAKSPKELIIDRVLLEAKRLLVHSNLSIKEIAYNLGFAEPTNFTKYFARHIRNTPSEFRDKYQ